MLEKCARMLLLAREFAWTQVSHAHVNQEFPSGGQGDAKQTEKAFPRGIAT